MMANMTDTEDDSDRDAYREVRDANVAFLGETQLRFHLSIDPLPISGPLEGRGTLDDGAIKREYVRQVEDPLNAVVAEAGLTVKAEPWGGRKTGGPIPEQQYAVQILGIVVGAMGSIVVLVEFADVIRRAIAKAKELTKNDVGISNGHAVILAADAIFNSTGERELSFAFETPMNQYLPDVHEGWSTFDGWLIGFRSRDRLHIAHVDWFGGVTLADGDVSVSWTPKG